MNNKELINNYLKNLNKNIKRVFKKHVLLNTIPSLDLDLDGYPYIIEKRGDHFTPSSEIITLWVGNLEISIGKSLRSSYSFITATIHDSDNSENEDYSNKTIILNEDCPDLYKKLNYIIKVWIKREYLYFTEDLPFKAMYGSYKDYKHFFKLILDREKRKQKIKLSQVREMIKERQQQGVK